jgi:hypothetical protein
MTFSEAASETPRRGRPPVFSDQLIEFYTGLFPEIRTRRGIVDLAYGMQALGVLTDDPHPERFHWLCDKAAMAAGEPGASRPSLLTELGRFNHDDLIIDYAEQLCALDPKPTTKQAIAMLRQCRLNSGR